MHATPASLITVLALVVGLGGCSDSASEDKLKAASNQAASGKGPSDKGQADKGQADKGQADKVLDEATHGDPGAGISWIHDDYDKALAEAKASRRPLVVDLWAPWCHTCISMQKTVLTKAPITQKGAAFVWLGLDTDKKKNESALTKMGISAWPTFYVLDPATEKPLARHVGAATVEQFDAFLQHALDADAENKGEKKDALSPALKKLTAADQAAAAEDRASAAKLYKEALDLGGEEWPHRFEVRTELAETLLRLGQAEACLDLALEVMDDQGRAGSASGPDFVSVAHGCANKLRPDDKPKQGGTPDAAPIPHPHPKGEQFMKKATAGFNSITNVLQDPRARLSADDKSDALRILQELHEERGEKGKAMSMAMMQKQVLDQAMKHAKDAEEQAGYAWPREELYVYLGIGEKLLPELKRNIRQLPGQYDPPYRLAWLLNKLGHYDEAKKHAQAAINFVYGPRKVRAYQLLLSIEKNRKSDPHIRAAYWGLLTELEALPDDHRMRKMLPKAREGLAEVQARIKASGAADAAKAPPKNHAGPAPAKGQK